MRKIVELALAAGATLAAIAPALADPQSAECPDIERLRGGGSSPRYLSSRATVGDGNMGRIFELNGAKVLGTQSYFQPIARRRKA
jgi:hypothetical protein